MEGPSRTTSYARREPRPYQFSGQLASARAPGQRSQPIDRSVPDGDGITSTSDSDQIRSRILLGIDYGTTYTGLAWAVVTPNKSPTIDDIKLFQRWPTKDSQKVPSVISYSPTEQGCTQWGFDIDNGSDVLQWTKLELEPRERLKELDILNDLMQGFGLIRKLHAGESAITPDQISKSSEDVVRDYMCYVLSHYHDLMSASDSTLQGSGRNVLTEVPLDVVITHPANWKYEALNKTYRAIMGAMPRGMFPKLRDIYMVSEPESCALYTVQDMVDRDRNKLTKGACFVMCDAGGGTIDLATYCVESVDPLALKRIGYLASDTCGAVFIDRRFLAWCDEQIENMDMVEEDYGTGGHYIIKPKGRMLLSRFEKWKHHYTGTESPDISIPRGAIVKQSQAQAASNTGTLTVDNKDMNQIFSKSVDGTVNLIRKQIAQVDGRTIDGHYCRITYVFLAGGLSENEYVQRKIKESVRQYGSRMQVELAREPWSGVVKGAVMTGIGMGVPVPPKVSQCPRHYAISVSQEYKDWQHTDQDLVQDVFHGRRMARDPIIGIIRKGDLILGHPINKEITINCKFTESAYQAGNRTVGIVFVGSDLEELPSRLANLPRASNQVATIDIPLTLFDIATLTAYRQTNGAGRYYQANVTVRFSIFRDVQVEVVYQGVCIKTFSTNL